MRTQTVTAEMVAEAYALRERLHAAALASNGTRAWSAYQKACGRAFSRKLRHENSLAPKQAKPAFVGLHIEGRRWFQRTYGNTYHSVRIYANGAEIAYSGRHYGYGDQYLQTALAILKEQGLAPADAEYGTRYLREVLGGTYSVIDVPRQKDL